jgi:hypothetical protein
MVPLSANTQETFSNSLIINQVIPMDADVVEGNEEMAPVVAATKTVKKMEKTGEDAIMDLPGVGAATAEKLISAGFDDLMSIGVATPGEIVDASGVTEATARKLIKAARDALDMGFVSGTDVMAKRDAVLKISTGVPASTRFLAVASKRVVSPNASANMEVVRHKWHTCLLSARSSPILRVM